MKRMWVLVGVFCGVWIGSCVHAQDAASQVLACQGCHQGALSFQGKSASELMEAMVQLPASGKPHPPLPVASADTAALEALVQALLDAANQNAAGAALP